MKRKRPTGTVMRLDYAPIRKAKVTPQGFLRFDAAIGRVGVLTYKTATGNRREFRPPEEVFSAQSMGSAAGAVVTDMHPPREQAWITSQNWKKFQVGMVGDTVRQDGLLLTGTVTVQDADVIDKIKSGQRREISPGYVCRLDMTPGRWNGSEYGPHVQDGIAYDAVQRDIMHNSVGLGPPGWGRQGSTVALRLDAGDGFALDSSEDEDQDEDEDEAEQPLEDDDDEDDDTNDDDADDDEEDELDAEALDDERPPPIRGGRRKDSHTETDEMDSIEMKLDGLTVTLPKSAAEVVRKAITDRDGVITRQKGLLEAAAEEHSKLEARFDAAMDEVAAKDKELGELPHKLKGELAARAALETQARQVLGAEVKLDEMSARQVQQAVLGRLAPELKLDAKDDTYVAARFDIAMEGYKPETASEKARKAALGGGRPMMHTDSADDPDPAAARAEMVKRNQQAWSPKN